MSSSDFRQLEFQSSRTLKGDRLFRAAISAFCALTRPSRREIAQLDDLALPLVDAASKEDRRYAAAALSECRHAPPLLVRRLANDATDIAAPLLMRSPALRDVDLISLIANCGLTHARAIARRTNLAKPIHDLLTALKDPEIDRLRAIATGHQGNAARPPRGAIAAEARRKLRAMMRPADVKTYHSGLRDAALSGRPPLFQTALADALGLGFERVRQITESDQLTEFAIALKALDAGTEFAFLLVSAIRPAVFYDAEQIRWFINRYETLKSDKAMETVRRWKMETSALPAPALSRAS